MENVKAIRRWKNGTLIAILASFLILMSIFITNDLSANFELSLTKLIRIFDNPKVNVSDNVRLIGSIASNVIYYLLYLWLFLLVGLTVVGLYNSGVSKCSLLVEQLLSIFIFAFFRVENNLALSILVYSLLLIAIAWVVVYLIYYLKSRK